MLHAGARLGDRYLLLEPVARGGMGEVWRAEDTVLGRIVAVKVLRHELAGDSDFAQRFRAEARAMAALSDPSVVEVHDFGHANGVIYLVMQFVPGESLRALLNRLGPLAPHHTMQIVAQAARALHLAHVNGIVHRDVKPGNLLIRPDGRVVLTDFGVAWIRGAERLTAAGEVFGTPTYLAPEQIDGGPLGPAADVYALGIVAYECLTLHPPFTADSAVGVALMQTRDEPPPLPVSVPESMRYVVIRALAKDPRQRWESAAAMAEAALAASVAGPADAPPTGPRPNAPATSSKALSRLDNGRIDEPRPSRRRLVLVAAATVLLLVGVGWAALHFGAIRSQALADNRPATAPLPGQANATRTSSAATSSLSTLTVTPAATATAVAPPTTKLSTVAGPPPPPGQSLTTTTTPTLPSPTASLSPGLVLLPDVVGMYSGDVDHELEVVDGLNVVVLGPSGNCRILSMDPPAGTVVGVMSTLNLYTSPSDCK
jgi:serine/threonine-protein kinase